VNRSARVTVAVAACVLTIAACGSKSNGTSSSSSSASGGGTATGAAFKACMVLDVGGVDDRSFNQSAWKGMTDAHTANTAINISYVSSSSQNDYTPNLNAEIKNGCQTTVAVGGQMTDAVKAAATANPTVKFGIIDSVTGQPNVYGMQFNTAQGAFVGGYLAAAMTKTGKVATYGGLNIPPVTVYMDGFWEGVQYYNQQKGKSVTVLGWNEKNQKAGTFAQSFTDQNKGRSISQAFIQQGADIIFPVAGGTGLGSGAAAQASGGKVSVIWVDTDGCVSAPQYCSVFLTSVVKNISAAVTEYVSAAASGTFPTGSSIGTLSNEGTGIAPFHTFASKVPADLQTELNQVKADIISGKITITSPSQPKS